MPTITLIDFLGWAGVAFYVAGYLLLTLGWLKSHQYSFHLLNILGAIGLIISSSYHHDVPNLAVNVVWLAIGLFAIGRQWFISSQNSG